MLGERPPVEELARTPLFGALDSRALAKLIGRVRVVDVAAGETLFRQGDPADSLYVVADGAVVPIAESPKGRTRLGVLEPGSFFGEIGLVTNQPRNATIEALVATRLLEIRRTAIWELVREQPEVFKVMLRFLRERLVDRLVRTSPLFRVFERAERSQVARQFRFLEVKDGTVVIEQKRPSPSLFVLLAGHLDVILMDTDGDKQLARLKPGDVCGERSMLLGEPAMAAVVASGKCWLLALDADRFARILERNPKLQQVIERVCEARSRANDSTFRKALRAGEGDLGLI
jgi:cAMP-dependent protein kinase regulator